METPEDMTTRHVLQGQALMDYLVERAAERAKDAIIERDERRKRIVTLIFSIIALVGISGLVSIFKIYVRSELDVFNDRLNEANLALDNKLDKKADMLVQDLQNRVKDSVSKEIADQVGAVKKILDEDDVVERYVELAIELPDKVTGPHRREDKYVSETFAEIVQAAEQMAQIKQSTRRRRRFFMSTRSIVEVMRRMNRETELNRFDDLFGELMAADQELTRKLVDHYGQLVIGSPQTIDVQPDNMRRLKRYMQAAHDLGYPEKALLWSVFVEFKRNNFTHNSTVRSLLESSRDLVETDRAEFWYAMLTYTDLNYWMYSPTQQGRELEHLMAALQEQYPEITQVMKDNLEAYETLQARLDAARGTNHDVQETPVASANLAPAATPESQTPAAPATASGGANTLRH